MNTKEFDIVVEKRLESIRKANSKIENIMYIKN